MTCETKNCKSMSQSEINNRVLALFKFIQELNKLKQRTILNVKDYRWNLVCAELPNDPKNIKLFYQDQIDDDVAGDFEQDNVILSVHKEDFEPCPTPPSILDGWLLTGWKDYRLDVTHQNEKSIIIKDPNTGEEIEKKFLFNEEPNRVNEYCIWTKVRAKWAKDQTRIARNRLVFDDLYSEYFALKRDSEVEEIIVANGVLCDSVDRSICHPVLTRRVKLDFDATNNTMFIRDTEAVSEIYTDILKALDDVNLQEINALQDRMAEHDYHPLDRNETPGFLKELIRRLSSNSTYSDEGGPDGWEHSYRFLLYNAPSFIIRKRQDGTVGAIEKINEAIEAGLNIPKMLIDLVSGSKANVLPDDKEYSLEDQLAMVGGESVDILLSKEANREQLEIAQRIENYNAVLVQGPPGTGKTHTIANLLGHFIAQGKSVLVTSHTTKALDVLKEKIAPGLQSLCVSLLDDSNKDMEQSVEGITSFMSQNSSSSIKKEMDTVGEERKNIISELAKVRKKIFMSIQKECESITYQGESLTPTEAAKFVALNQEKLDYIPGSVKADVVLPLTFDELVELYRSNETITEADAAELSFDLPSPDELLSVNEFDELCLQVAHMEDQIKKVNEDGLIHVIASMESRTISFRIKDREFLIPYPSIASVQKLKEYCIQYGKIDNWQKAVALDGKSGGGYRDRWVTLSHQIETAGKLGAELADKGLGRDISFAEDTFSDELLNPLREVKQLYDDGGLPFMFAIFHKKLDKALKSVRVCGKVPSSSEECELAILHIKLKRARTICNNSWQELLMPYGVPSFRSLGPEPERVAEKYVHSINIYLNWALTDYTVLGELLQHAGFPENDMCGISELDSEQLALNKRLNAIHDIIPACCDVCMDILELANTKERLVHLSQIVTKGNRVNSDILKNIYHAIDTHDSELYRISLATLETVYEKYNILFRRNEYLKRLTPYAPDWAEAIRNHDGIHGESVVRSDILDAWKWRQLSMMLEEITEIPVSKYQTESRRLSQAYRKITAEYAEKSGWYHLLLKTEANLDLQQALQGWRAVVKKIGKGTGKRAPKLRIEARQLMAKCQNAVPAWIMPIRKAMESLNPARNAFDIVIVDEASQSDISSLAILYMGKKLIIVGDDKQVSPMAVGVDEGQVDKLRQMYLPLDFPNRIMYDAQTSIYDIALTTYHPLMLKEHFRCVPEIIGYSNWLSYDGKIIPLRSASSSNLLPAVVNYRVDDGNRNSKQKINENEARSIIALMKSCMEQPEYNGKTFGVISLLGSDQAKYIERLIGQDEDIKAKDIKERHILCGDSSNFQGDERDVIFLSMVDSSSDPAAPLSLQGFGVQDSTRKRYNVAASRARDQLWVINSLDHNVNLKAGDIRKGLIEYALNPNNVIVQKAAVTSLADSEFEVQVAMKLKARGYHIVQQWEVGAYRIDMVAVCGEKKIAIECDGDRYHSSPLQVRNDMERQTILERIGWTFIRIRGSEYFRNPEQTIERVSTELRGVDIYPEVDKDSISDVERGTVLLDRIKHRAELILHPDLTNEDIPEKRTHEDLNASIIEPTPTEEANGHNEFSKETIPNNLGKTITYALENQNSVALGTVVEESIQSREGIDSSFQGRVPEDLQQAAAVLGKHHYHIINNNRERSCLLLIGEKEIEHEVVQLLGNKFVVKWFKRGMKQTDNKSFFIIRRI